MNVLFLTLVKIDNIDRQGIYTDLLRNFKKNGHNVYIVSPLERRLGQKTEYLTEGNVNYLKVRVGNLIKTNALEKGISTLTLENLYLKAIKKYLNDVNFDLVLYSTPPITFDKIIRFVKLKSNAKSYLLLKDIFPQNAVDLRMITKKNPLYWYFRRKEIKLYKNSDYIGCMSQKNVEYVLKNNPDIPSEIVEVCPNGIDPINIKNNDAIVKDLRNKYKIPIDSTVFLYGGNLGKPQGIDFLIDCLKSNSNNNKVYFIIAGSGTEFNKVRNYFEKEKPSNAQLFNHLPKEEYERLASACDVGLIFLDKRFTIPNFPSRLLSYMQASMPVLAATDSNTDIGIVIENGKFGFWCESNSVDEFNSKLNKLCNEKLRAQMGKNSRKYLENNYTAKNSYEIIMSHFK